MSNGVCVEERIERMETPLGNMTLSQSFVSVGHDDSTHSPQKSVPQGDVAEVVAVGVIEVEKASPRGSVHAAVVGNAVHCDADAEIGEITNVNLREVASSDNTPGPCIEWLREQRRVQTLAEQDGVCKSNIFFCVVKYPPSGWVDYVPTTSLVVTVCPFTYELPYFF